MGGHGLYAGGRTDVSIRRKREKQTQRATGRDQEKRRKEQMQRQLDPTLEAVPEDIDADDHTASDTEILEALGCL